MKVTVYSSRTHPDSSSLLCVDFDFVGTNGKPNFKNFNFITRIAFLRVDLIKLTTVPDPSLVDE